MDTPNGACIVSAVQQIMTQQSSSQERAHHGSSPGRRSTKFSQLNFKKGDAGAADKDYSRGNLVCMSRSIYEYIRCARCVRDLFWWKISLSTLKRRALRRPLAFTDRPLDGRAPKWLIGRIDCVLGVLILFKSGWTACAVACAAT